MTIKWIFFDFDGVLTSDKSGSFSTCNYLSQFIPNKTFEEILDTYRIWHKDMLIGKTFHKDIWQEFCLKLGIVLDYKILEDAFLTTPINTQMINLTQSLKENYKIGIITDNSSERMKLISDKKKFNELFDLTFISGETGFRKNNEIIFNLILERTAVKPNECIFIDNSSKNLVVPEKLGFKTIFYDYEKKDVFKLGTQIKKLLK